MRHPRHDDRLMLGVNCCPVTMLTGFSYPALLERSLMRPYLGVSETAQALEGSPRWFLVSA